MDVAYQNPQALLNNGSEAVTDFEILVFGTHDTIVQLDDTFGKALCRYMEDNNIGTTLSRYSHGIAPFKKRYIYAICIALRLKTCQQRHLLALVEKTMPDERGHNRSSAYIIRDFLDGCSYNYDDYNLAECNKLLISKGYKPLTRLGCKKEDINK